LRFDFLFETACSFDLAGGQISQTLKNLPDRSGKHLWRLILARTGILLFRDSKRPVAALKVETVAIYFAGCPESIAFHGTAERKYGMRAPPAQVRAARFLRRHRSTTRRRLTPAIKRHDD
jgi:hypothetical protein